MAATRTQVYFTREQRRLLDERARREGKTLAEVVREAVDAYTAESGLDFEQSAAATFGATPDLNTPSRDEWDRGYG
jgi:predicted DNA-binding protein